jgi:glycosyltransferase involved in cell wall biosynthesis/SAM-dependent methyltransferase
MIQPVCWCGRRDLTPFGEHYRACACGTLVRSPMLTNDITRVKDEERDLYGRNYWFAHQAELGLPDLEHRRVSDMRDRCLHWLRIVLAYKAPPGRVLEIGAAHGAFVALLADAGFGATGIELSPWVVEYASRTSGAHMLVGPVEDQELPTRSFDAIVAFDVLEHLPDPIGTITRCARLLRDDGLLILQTPCRQPGIDYSQASRTRFREMLIPEHLYLFAESSARELLRRAGLGEVVTESPVFETDMILVAGRHQPHRVPSSCERSQPPMRLVYRLLSMDEAMTRERTGQQREIEALDARYRAADHDRAERLRRMEELAALYQQADSDRVGRQRQIESLEALLAQADRDRTERQRQIETLAPLFAEADRDRTERQHQIEALENRLALADRERTERQGQIDALDARYAAADRDRTERQQQIETLEALYRQADGDRRERQQQIETLQALYDRADRDRTERQHQIDRLKALYDQADRDRIERQHQIDRLEALYDQADRDRTERQRQIDRLEALYDQANRDRTERQHQIETLEALYDQANRDRTGRQHQIDTLEARYRQADQDRTGRLRRIEELEARNRDADASRREQLRQIEGDLVKTSDRLDALRAVVEDHRNSRLYKAMVRSGRWRAFDAKAQAALNEPAPPRLVRPRDVDEGTWTFHTRVSPRPDGAIAIDLTAILPGGENGGAKLVATELVRAFSRVAPDRRFLLLTSASSHHEVAALEAPNVRRRPVDPAPTALSELLEEERVSAMFCPMTSAPFDDPRVPVVCLVHDLQYLTYAEFFDDAEREERQRAFRRATRLADQIVTPSRYVRSTVLEHSTLTETRVTPIAHGFSVQRLPRPSERSIAEALERYGLERGRYFIYPANFWPHKNHLMLLVAFGQLTQHRPDLDVRLVLTGASRPQPRIVRESVKRMRLDDRVLLPGYLLDSELAALMAGALALVLPSLYEGFGMPVTEAFSAGCPVACSSVTSLPEVAGDAALYFDPRRPDDIADVLERLARCPALVSDLRNRGYQRLGQMDSAEQVARDYLAVIDRAASEPRQPRNQLAGVFTDRWTTSSLVVANDQGLTDLQLELENPRDEPVTLTADGVEAMVVEPHRTLALKCVLPAAAGTIRVSIDPTFRPSEAGSSIDTRALGVRVNACTLGAAGSDRVDLLSTLGHV